MGELSSSDYKYAESFDIKAGSLDKQWNRLKEGFPTLILDRPATIGDGIHRFNKDERSKLIRFFDQEKSNYKIIKFVPASGAASRMFLPFRSLLEEAENDQSKELISKIKDFPFYEDILIRLEEKGLRHDSILKDRKALAHFILDKSGMNYDNYPKGLISFYRNGKIHSNAFQQHVHEAEVISDKNIHFTVSDDYLKEIKVLLNDPIVEFSIQNASSHYISMDNGSPLRNKEGNLIFRPSGHGALLKNLNAIDADIVFIKNIDNIQIPERNRSSIEVKKIIASYLIELKQQVDTFLFQLEEDIEAPFNEIEEWINENFDIAFRHINVEETISYLNRPIRVAGMVINEGKAGGGPFWVRNKYGVNLQIVESAQINKNDPDQLAILNSSSHFNPVDIACSLIDHHNRKFDLEKYVDEESGFLSTKKVNGKEVTIMERPGLWNGSMANWLSAFIEVPLESFTPVKNVLDLLPIDEKI